VELGCLNIPEKLIKFPNKLIPNKNTRRNIMGDILKEAIADAKAVRETALQNAKMALEEAFTPQLKSMLSAKLKEDDMDDDDEVSMGEEEEDDDEAEEGYHEGEHEEDDDEPEEGMHDGGEEDDDEPEEGMHEEGIIEIDGVKYAPVVSEEEIDEIGEDQELEIENDNLDLEAVIRELETELKEEDDAYDEKAAPGRDGLAEEDDAYDEKASADRDGLAEDEDIEIDDSVFTEEEDEDDDKEEVDEQSGSSQIGSGDNKLDYADSGDEEDPGKGKMYEIQSELKEYKEAVKFLKDKLHEVNILNAKLLFTNKLFKEFALDNNQKLKVVETFDRTQSTREIKLVYSTLAEQFSDNGSINKRNPIKESASSTIGSTKPSEESKKVITEEDNVADRFRKLAGIING
jgi:hypothetical protein